MGAGSGRVLHIGDFSPGLIAGSGQCFRMTGEEPAGNGAVWSVNAMGRVLYIEETEEGFFRFSCGREEFESVWFDYFDLGYDYSACRAAVLPDDAFLKEAVSCGMGIRILRQEPWETLISFIISQRKSVPAITTSVERMARLFGKPLGNGFYGFPDAASISAASDEELKSCGLGYRVPYVRKAARERAEGRLDLEGYSKLPTGELIGELMKLDGVGIKVASCTALFGYHRLDTLPVDVWMKRVIDTVYGGKFPEEYAPYAGVLQQYMFNYARIVKTGV